MARINPGTAKRQREKLGLSMDELAGRSGIDKGTIYRIEAGRLTRNNNHTITTLAKHLKLDVDAITSSESQDDGSIEAVLYPRSQMNVRISNECRNALVLVANRYGVRASHIVEFAPLLFLIVAEESLKTRKERLDDLQSARRDLELHQKLFSHLGGLLTCNWQGEEIEAAEEDSIAARDIRGRLIWESDKISDSDNAHPFEYDEEGENPFVMHLRSRVEEVEPEVDAVEGQALAWSEFSGPRYSICKAEALGLFDGDSQLAEALLLGVIGIHELPRELRSADAMDARIAWARERVEAAAAKQVDIFDKLEI